MLLTKIKNEIRDIKRLEEIIKILGEEEFHFIVQKILGKNETKIGMVSPERVRKLFEKLGPTFVKLGQLLSIRGDLVPHEYCEEFRKLQDNVSSVPYDKIDQIISLEFGAASKNLKNFQKKPFSTASISQVHLATLNGKKVAVKIQKPGIRKIIEADVDILEFIAREFEKHEEYKALRPVKIIEEFKEYTERELDFKFEQRNLKKFHEYFKDWKDVGIPEVYPEYTTSKILVTEFIEGYNLNNKEKVRELGIDFKKIAKMGFTAILYQIFDLGFLHGDPHPANVIASKDKKIYFIDFGIVGYINPEFQENLLKAIISLVNKDIKSVIKYFLRISHVSNSSDIDNFKKDAEFVINSWYGSTFREMRFTAMLFELIKCATKNNIEVSSEIVLVAKGLLTTEGTGYEYDPDFDVVKELKPVLNKLIMKKFSAENVESQVKKDAMLFGDFLYSLPDNAQNLLEKIEKGEISVKIQSEEIREIEKTIGLNSDKKSLSLLIGMIFLGSAVIAHLNVEYTLFGYPFAVFGFGICLVLSVFLMGIFIKERKYLK